MEDYSKFSEKNISIAYNTGVTSQVDLLTVAVVISSVSRKAKVSEALCLKQRVCLVNTKERHKTAIDY